MNSPPPNSASEKELGAVLAQLRQEFGGDTELLKQGFADLNAQQRQDARNNFEGRLEYVKQIAELKRIQLTGIVEYGSQTLKWCFLLNAGSIAAILAYLGAVAKSQPAWGGVQGPLLGSLWPFAAGCVFVVASGAAAFLNFSYAETTLPSAEALNNFLDPKNKNWPIARFQHESESGLSFVKRHAWKVSAARTAAIVLCLLSALAFGYGVYDVLRVTFGSRV